MSSPLYLSSVVLTSTVEPFQSSISVLSRVLYSIVYVYRTIGYGWSVLQLQPCANLAAKVRRLADYYMLMLGVRRLYGAV
jgi:hypothetical protein